MKKILTSILATTGFSLPLLSGIACLYGAVFLRVQTVFQVLTVNAAIHLGLLVIRRVESRHPAIEAARDLAFILALLLMFGKIFHWYTSTPPRILVMMGITGYALSLFLNLLYMKQEADALNQLIQTMDSRR